MKQLFTPLFACLLSGAALAQAPLHVSESVAARQQQHRYSPVLLVATNTVQGMAAYTSAQAIELRPGFTAQAGSVFSARIQVEALDGALEVQAYPNPFGTSVRIEYVLPASARVRHSLTDMQGRVVHQEELGEQQPAGRHSVEVSGVGLNAGTYLYRIDAGDKHQTLRLLKNQD